MRIAAILPYSEVHRRLIPFFCSPLLPQLSVQDKAEVETVMLLFYTNRNRSPEASLCPTCCIAKSTHPAPFAKSKPSELAPGPMFPRLGRLAGSDSSSARSAVPLRPKTD